MSKIVIKNTETQFVCKVQNSDSTTLTMANTDFGGVTPTSLSVISMHWSSSSANNDYVQLSHGANSFFDLHGSGSIDTKGEGFSFDIDKTGDLTIATSSAGHKYSLILNLRKG